MRNNIFKSKSNNKSTKLLMAITWLSFVVGIIFFMVAFITMYIVSKLSALYVMIVLLCTLMTSGGTFTLYMFDKIEKKVSETIKEKQPGENAKN